MKMPEDIRNEDAQNLYYHINNAVGLLSTGQTSARAFVEEIRKVGWTIKPPEPRFTIRHYPHSIFSEEYEVFEHGKPIAMFPGEGGAERAEKFVKMQEEEEDG